MKKIVLILLAAFTFSFGAHCFAASYKLSPLRGYQSVQTQTLSDTGTGSIGCGD